MSTILEKLTKLNTIKSDIKASIEAKGVNIGNVPFSQYSSKIDAITAGDSTGPTINGVVANAFYIENMVEGGKACRINNLYLFVKNANGEIQEIQFAGYYSMKLGEDTNGKAIYPVTRYRKLEGSDGKSVFFSTNIFSYKNNIALDLAYLEDNGTTSNRGGLFILFPTDLEVVGIGVKLTISGFLSEGINAVINSKLVTVSDYKISNPIKEFVIDNNASYELKYNKFKMVSVWTTDGFILPT